MQPGSLLIDDSQNRPSPVKTKILGLLQIRILHFQRRREKSFPTIKMLLVLNLYQFEIVYSCRVNAYGLGHFPRSENVFRGKNYCWQHFRPSVLSCDLYMLVKYILNRNYLIPYEYLMRKIHFNDRKAIRIPIKN